LRRKPCADYRFLIGKCLGLGMGSFNIDLIMTFSVTLNPEL